MKRLKMAGIMGLAMLCAGAAWAAPGEVGGDHSMTHRMMLLVIQLGVICFAARLGNMLFERIRMPGVLGELVAGMLIGPYLLGGLWMPGFPDGLFPAMGTFPVSPELYGICAVASVVLLFMVGLETDIRLFVRYSLSGSLVGIGGVLVSFVLGDLLAVLFSPLLFGERLGFFAPPCLFLGIISTPTSVGITARILSDKRKLDSPEGVTVLAGAVVDDVLGIVLLAIGLGVISASGHSGAVDWGRIGVIALKAVGVWLAATIVGLLASRRISVLLKWFKSPSSIAVMALGLALIMAGLFEEAGLAMIVGAYVVGLSLARTDINHLVRERLHPIAAFLVPVFFTVMGMLVDFRTLASPRVLLFGLVYTVVADVAKVVGSGGPALLTSFNLRGALRIGVGMLPRGEVTLIIAGIGLAAGVLTPQLFGVVVMMLLVTALIAPPLIAVLFEHPATGLRTSSSATDEGERLAFSFPTAETARVLLERLVRTFESEGFFVHAMDRTRELFQLRKDRIIIGMHREDHDVVFNGARADVPFIHTAMVEVVAELEGLIRELRCPVDATSIVKRVQEHVPGAGGGTSLAAYISPDVLVPRLDGATKEAVIEELLDVLAREGCVTDRDAARRVVMDREQTMSTGMQHGIAIPHGRTDAVAKLVCAVGLKPEGIDFEAIDGEPSRIFVLTLSPRTASAPHMQFMSMVSQVLDEAGRDALLACVSSGQMYRVLTGPSASQT